MHTGVIGKSVNKHRVVCDKIADYRYSKLLTGDLSRNSVVN